jgi:hypothetical protein
VGPQPITLLLVGNMSLVLVGNMSLASIVSGRPPNGDRFTVSSRKAEVPENQPQNEGAALLKKILP